MCGTDSAVICINKTVLLLKICRIDIFFYTLLAAVNSVVVCYVCAVRAILFKMSSLIPFYSNQ